MAGAFSNVIFDILRHLAVLHRVAQDNPEAETRALLSMSINEKAFHLSLKTILTTCFTASVVLMIQLILLYLRFGGIGSIVQSKRVKMRFERC